MENILKNTQDIIIQSKNGDTHAFRLLMERYQNYAYSLAFRILYNEEDAKDIVQETFIRIWKHLSDFRFKNKFTTWLYRIVVNLCLDRIKMRKRRHTNMRHCSEQTLNDIPDRNCNIEKNFTDRETVGIIENLSEKLSPKQRMVFVLRDFQNLSIKEVSQILGMPIHSVKSNLYHARRNLRIKIEKIYKI